MCVHLSPERQPPLNLSIHGTKKNGRHHCFKLFLSRKELEWFKSKQCDALRLRNLSLCVFSSACVNQRNNNDEFLSLQSVVPLTGYFLSAHHHNTTPPIEKSFSFVERARRQNFKRGREPLISTRHIRYKLMMTSPARSHSSRAESRSPLEVLSTVKSPPVPLLRSRIEMVGQDRNPGPGAYDISSPWKGNAVPWRPDVFQPKVVNPRDLPPVEEVPVKSQLSKRAPTIGLKLNTPALDYPGPGDYDPKLPSGKSSPRIQCTFGCAHGEGTVKNKLIVPGPGSYDPVDVRAPSPRSVALKSRLSVKSPDHPGPGHYDHKDLIGTGLSSTFGGSRK